MRSLKFGVDFLSIWWILDAIAEHLKLVYGKLIVTCVRLDFWPLQAVWLYLSLVQNFDFLFR